METKWFAARARLYHLQQRHPMWSYKQLAQETGYSYNWVRKWCGRFAEVETEKLTIF